MVQLSQAPRLSAATECNHEANICPKGLQETLEKAISEGHLQDVRCPDAECKAKYAVRDIRSIVSKESFAELVIDAPLSGYGSPAHKYLDITGNFHSVICRKTLTFAGVDLW